MTTHAQLITYRVASGLDPVEYTDKFVGPYSEYFAGLSALVSKVWLADRTAGTGGGFYVWRDRAAMDGFMASDAVGQLMSSPYVSDVTSTDWPVDEQPTRVTRGLPTTAGA